MGEDLISRVERLVDEADGGRVLLGVVGCPGAGKSTLTSWLAQALSSTVGGITIVPMDGFHLADEELRRLGLLERKGAIETFDGWGYLATLRRLRSELTHTVYAPTFERTLEQPIAGAIGVPPEATLVITEGNYLLSTDEPWALVRHELDEVWFVDVDDDLRRERLIARHVHFGKSPEEARAWVDSVDEPNARAILRTRHSADLVVRLPGHDWRGRLPGAGPTATAWLT